MTLLLTLLPGSLFEWRLIAESNDSVTLTAFRTSYIVWALLMTAALFSRIRIGHCSANDKDLVALGNSADKHQRIDSLKRWSPASSSTARFV